MGLYHVSNLKEEAFGGRTGLSVRIFGASKDEVTGNQRVSVLIDETAPASGIEKIAISFQYKGADFVDPLMTQELYCVSSGEQKRHSAFIQIPADSKIAFDGLEVKGSNAKGPFNYKIKFKDNVPSPKRNGTIRPRQCTP